MRAERMELRDFRNLRETVWQPGPGINVIWGENAQGKTNLLEALWLFTGSKKLSRGQGSGIDRAEPDRGAVEFGLLRRGSAAGSGDQNRVPPDG